MYSFEPDSNQWPKDALLHSTVLRSTNWAIEGSDDKMVVSNPYQTNSALTLLETNRTEEVARIRTLRPQNNQTFIKWTTLLYLHVNALFNPVILYATKWH